MNRGGGGGGRDKETKQTIVAVDRLESLGMGGKIVLFICVDNLPDVEFSILNKTRNFRY